VWKMYGDGTYILLVLGTLVFTLKGGTKIFPNRHQCFSPIQQLMEENWWKKIGTSYGRSDSMDGNFMKLVLFTPIFSHPRVRKT
jgi:hypothetical protein